MGLVWLSRLPCRLWTAPCLQSVLPFLICKRRVKWQLAHRVAIKTEICKMLCKPQSAMQMLVLQGQPPDWPPSSSLCSLPSCPTHLPQTRLLQLTLLIKNGNVSLFHIVLNLDNLAGPSSPTALTLPSPTVGSREMELTNRLPMPLWSLSFHLLVVTAPNLGLMTSLDGGLNEMIHIKHPAQCLARSRTSVIISYYGYCCQ